MPISNNRPRHEQITFWLRDRIRSGHFAIDDKLPSESELARQFKVSRVTVRRALQTLEGEHMIYRSQGLGSFVKGRKTAPDPLNMNDFMEEMRMNGLDATSIVLESIIDPAPKDVASRLNLEVGTKVFRLVRLRLANGNPIALDYTWLPAFYGQLVVDDDLKKRTIFSILEKEYNIEITSGCYYLQAENATDYLSTHLGVPKGSALFRMDRISFTLGDKPVYYQQRYYRNDRMMYRMKVERNKVSGENGKMPLSEFSAEFQSQDLD
ncbi:MAG: GntR family transcriptional regulator [Balneolales bacterium]